MKISVGVACAEVPNSADWNNLSCIHTPHSRARLHPDNTMITTNYRRLLMRHACAMTKRTTVLAATLVTLVGLAVPIVGTSAQATPARPDIDPSEWCGNQAPPCVVSASRNGVAITESDPTYAVSAAG